MCAMMSTAHVVDAAPPAGRFDNRIPLRMESVTIDRADDIYTAGGSNDAGADLVKWDLEGKHLFDGWLKIRYERFEGAAYSVVVDEEYVYCAVRGRNAEPWNNRQQIWRFGIKDGKFAPFTGKSEKFLMNRPQLAEKARRAAEEPGELLVDGTIQVYEWPGLQIPAKTPPADAELMKAPLRGLDVAGSTLYVADALGGKVRMYDSTTGAPKGEFDVHLPHAVAVDPTGQIWVAHNHDTVTAFRADGYSGVTYGGMGEITSLAFGPGGKLYATDSATGQVLTLDTAGSPVKFVPVLGSKAKTGDTAPDRFFKLMSVAADGKGNLVTIDAGAAAGGARMAKWSLEKKLLWERSSSTGR